jgi:hypothetical protein
LLPLDEEQKKLIMYIAEDLSATDAEARRLLIKWLKEYHDPDKDNLRQYLSSSDSHIEKVFFVWTENLPKMRDIRSYPIERFEPKQGDIGTEVTIHATEGYDFTKAIKLYFNGREARFRAESAKVIKAVVPDGATTGFIEIEIEEDVPQIGKIKDEGTSEQHFIVNQSGKQRYAPPQSYGLIKFLSWCLDKSPQELIQDFEASIQEGNNPDPSAGK